MTMHLPTITIVDQDGEGVDLDTADVATLAQDYTQSELSVISALLKVAHSKVVAAEMELSIKNTPARPVPIHPGF